MKVLCCYNMMLLFQVFKSFYFQFDYEFGSDLMHPSVYHVFLININRGNGAKNAELQDAPGNYSIKGNFMYFVSNCCEKA